MSEVVRIDFEEHDRQWKVALTGADGDTIPGEPFPASDADNFSKLEQVLRRLTDLGYRPLYTPYDKVHARAYTFEVAPLES